MAASGADLRVKISADLADIRQGLGMLRGDIAKLKQESAKAPSTNGWSAGLKSIRQQLVGILSVYAAMRAIRWYADASDQASQLTGRIRQVTRTQEDFNRVYSQTYKMAQASQSDWKAIVNLYAQLSQTTGQSQERILGLTNIIGQSFRVSGSSAADTTRGIIQLQQAMAGGTLRAQEFNTLLETNPRLVQALADHFKIRFGEVRKYVNDGKISVEAMMKALEESASSINTDFNRLPKTIGGAMQQVQNSLVGLVSDTNTATGAANDLAEGISGLAETLSSSEVKQGFQSFVQGIATAVGWLAKLLTTTAGVTKFVGEEIAARVGGPAVGDKPRIEAAIARLQSRLNSRSMYGDAPDPIGRLFGFKSDTKEIQEEIARLQGLLRLTDELQTQAAAATEAPVVAAANASGAAAAHAAGSAKQIAESNALMRDSVSRALKDLERMYKDREIGIKQYFETRRQLQEQAIDLEIQQAQMELAVAKDAGQRRRLEEQILILQRNRAEIGAAAARDEQTATDELTDKLGQVKMKLLELDGNTARATRIQLETEYLELFQWLEANSDATGQAMVRNLIDRLVNKATADEIASRMSAATSTLSSTESSISTQMNAGTLGYVEGERRLQEARQKTLDQLRELREKQLEYLRSLAPDSPDLDAAVRGLDAIDANIANVTASMHTMRNGIMDQAVNSLTSFFSDLATGAKSFKDAFRDMVLGFIQGLAKMAAEMLAKRIIMSIFAKWFPLPSANGNAFNSSGTMAFARGGVFAAGLAGLTAFAAGGAFTNGVYDAPTMFTFGSGGQFGVMGEAGPEAVMPLERGPDGRLGVTANGGGGGIVTTPIVAIGDEAVANALASAAGERVVLTHVRNNWTGLTRG